MFEQLKSDAKILWKMPEEETLSHALRAREFAKSALESEEPESCVLACQVVENTARRSARAARACLSAGLVSVVVDFIKPSGRFEALVTDAAASALSALALTGEEAAKTAVREAGGVHALLDAMGDLEDPETVLSALYDVCKDSPENKEIVAFSSSLKLLLCFASNWNNTDSRQRLAINLLGTVMIRERRNKHALMRAGAVRVAVEALKSQSFLVRSEAALMVGQFAKGEEDADAETEAARLVCALAVPDLVNAVKRGADEPALFALERCVSHIESARGAATIDREALRCLVSYTAASHPMSIRHFAMHNISVIAEEEENAPKLVFCGAFEACSAVAQEGARSADNHGLYDSARDALESVRQTMRSLEVVRTVLLSAKHLRVRQAEVFRSLAHLCRPDHAREIFITNGGLDVLLGSLRDGSTREREAIVALHAKAKKPRHVNTPTEGARPAAGKPDQIVLVAGGERIEADATALASSSAVFSAMLCSVDWNTPREVPLAEVRPETIRMMVECASNARARLPTGLESLRALFEAADRYAMVELKQRCEEALAHHVTADTVEALFEVGEAHYADTLRDACVLWALRTDAWDCEDEAMARHLRNMMTRVLTT
jgi:hypothetical protein